jgi:hypothetical protein
MVQSFHLHSGLKFGVLNSSLSLSLSHTHTHIYMQTHTQTQNYTVLFFHFISFPFIFHKSNTGSNLGCGNSHQFEYHSWKKYNSHIIVLHEGHNPRQITVEFALYNFILVPISSKIPMEIVISKTKQYLNVIVVKIQ